ncbi:MAG: dihydroorotate dehydrogenase-like protein [Bacteroidales bacterium]|nr:dihydroorotate dehydrogenase-like protein [Bacteroidales bacterium]
MMDTRTKYLGLELKSPIVVGSCGLTADIDKLAEMEAAGAGAVILKSVFEEQIIYDIKRNTHVVAPTDSYGDSYEYIAQHVADDSMGRYFSLIREAKKRLSIPVIGSINCYSYENWLTYASKFQEAGCDALELNMAILPYETSLSADDVERTFGQIINTMRKSITIPISIKVGTYFTDMAKQMQQLSWMGIQGVTMFNKSVEVDIDIENETLKNASYLSTPEQLYNTLRWVAILSKKMRCDISASTGVYKPEDVVKMLLAGAGTVQVVSCLYKNGIGYLRDLNEGLTSWMQRKGYESLQQFRGKLAVQPTDKASVAMRTQFMKYFAEIV